MSTWIRNQHCPFCGSKSGYAINTQTDGYHCHRCKASGSLKRIGIDLDHDLKPIINRTITPTIPPPDPALVHSKLILAERGGLTDQYLSSRGIKFETWQDLGLREGVVEVMGEHGLYHFKAKACYAFRDFSGTIQAIHYVRHVGSERQKRYMGPKSRGVAMLKPTKDHPVIIAEGLENALAYRQMRGGLANGVCVAGDAGNMAKYASDHYVQLLPYHFIIVEDSDHDGKIASIKFSKMYRVKQVFRTSPHLDACDLLLTKNR